MTGDPHRDVEAFLEASIITSLRQLAQRRRSGWLKVLALGVVCAIGATGAASYFGFTVIGGDDALAGFVVGLGLSAGPAILLTVLGYFTLLRTPLRERYYTEIVAPTTERFAPPDRTPKELLESLDTPPPTPRSNPLVDIVETQTLIGFIEAIKDLES